MNRYILLNSVRVSDAASIVLPFVGELGWEICNWVPHVRGLKLQRPCVVMARDGRESLYRDFADRFIRFDGYEHLTEGNRLLSCDAGKEAILQLDSLCSLVQKAASPNAKIVSHSGRIARFGLLPDRSFIRYVGCRPADVFDVVIHLRCLRRTPGTIWRDSDVESYNAVVDWCEESGFSTATVGKTAVEPSFPIRGADLLNKTSIADLISLFSAARAVVGVTSGPMHLAAMVGTPHVVWGGGLDRGNSIAARYRFDWNPFRTPVRFVDRGRRVDPSAIVAALDEMAKWSSSAMEPAL